MQLWKTWKLWAHPEQPRAKKTIPRVNGFQSTFEEDLPRRFWELSKKILRIRQESFARKKTQRTGVRRGSAEREWEFLLGSRVRREREGRMLKQTTVYNVSLHLHAKFQSVIWKLDAVSAFSLIQGSNTFSSCYERLLSTRVSNVARLSLSKRAPVGWRRFRPSVAVVSGCRFRPNLGRMKFALFLFCSSLYFYATVKWIHVWWQCHILGETAFSVDACCALLRTCPFLSQPSLCMAQRG